MMSEVLQGDFGVFVQWREDRSRNTFENASFSAAILRRARIPAALVVAHRWDMARALWSFRAGGYPVAPMPTHKGKLCRFPWRRSGRKCPRYGTATMRFTSLSDWP